MLVTIQMHWVKSYGNTSGSAWQGTGKAFNTVTQQIEAYNPTYYQATLDPVPTDVPPPAVGGVLWYECGLGPDFDKTSWLYGAGDTVTVSVEHHATSCGWTPPPPPLPSCDLQISLAIVNGDTIQATATGAHGTVTFSRDAGASRNLTGRFGPLAAGRYKIYAYDDAPYNCQASATIDVTPTVATVLPSAVSLPAVGFSRNPLALVAATTTPGRALLIEVWLEKYHGAGQYTRLVQRLRPTDAAGQAVLQLQDQLHSALTPVPPDLGTGLVQLRRLGSVIRRYYVTVAEVQPASGAPGPALTLPAATVLRGGLAWAPARTTSFFDPLPAGFLTWRPATEHEVGRGHVALLAALVPAQASAATLRVRCFARGSATAFQTLTDVLPLVAPNLGQALSPFLVQAQVPTGVLPATTYRLEVALLVGSDVQATRTYRLSDTYRHRQYIFLNSLGQWDTLDCTGPLSSKTSVERTVATTLVAADYDPQGGPEAVVATTLDGKLTQSTGPLGAGELEYLRELFLSTDVYEVAGGQLRKIRLTSKDMLDYQDDAGADGLTFEYTYCFDTTLFNHARLTHF